MKGNVHWKEPIEMSPVKFDTRKNKISQLDLKSNLLPETPFSQLKDLSESPSSSTNNSIVKLADYEDSKLISR